jgi:hypothetical protein
MAVLGQSRYEDLTEREGRVIMLVNYAKITSLGSIIFVQKVQRERLICHNL